jgi:hypothetical protein
MSACFLKGDFHLPTTRKPLDDFCGRLLGTPGLQNEMARNVRGMEKQAKKLLDA